MAEKNRLTVVKETPEYWRVIFKNPPVNLFDPWMFAELNVLMDQMERSDDLRVVVFDPPVNLFDPWMFAELNVLMDQMERSDDLRVVVFESADENFFINHHDVEHRLQVPEQEGGRPFFYEWSNWVSRLVGRSRAIEIVCSSECYGAEIGEKYGFVTRAELDASVHFTQFGSLGRCYQRSRG